MWRVSVSRVRGAGCSEGAAHERGAAGSDRGVVEGWGPPQMKGQTACVSYDLNETFGSKGVWREDKVTVMGSARDCVLCGATGVPVGWSWRLYSHRAGKPYANSQVDAKRGQRCAGESADDHFARMLRNAEMMVTGPGMRLTTDHETDEVWRQRRTHVRRSRTAVRAGVQGELF